MKTQRTKIEELNDSTIPQLMERITPEQAEELYKVSEDVNYDFTAFDDDGQETRLFKGNLHVSAVDSGYTGGWNPYNLIIDGDLTVDGDFHWEEGNNGSFVMVMGNLSARNLLLSGNVEVVVQGNLAVQGVIQGKWGEDGSVLAVGGSVHAALIIQAFNFVVAFKNKQLSGPVITEKWDRLTENDYDFRGNAEDILIPECWDKESEYVDTDAVIRVAKSGGSVLKPIEARAAENIADWARKADMKAVQRLTNEGCDVNRFDNKGYTALHYVAIKGDAETACLLLSKKANTEVKAKTDEKETPLYLAAIHSNADVLKALIDAKANLNPVNSYGRSALGMACNKNKQKVALLLIEAGADIMLTDKYDQYPMQLAAESGGLSIVKRLLAMGSPINAQTNDGSTALQWAAEQGHLNIVKVLVEAGANPSIVNNNKKTALYLAEHNGHKRIAEYLKVIPKS